MAPTKLRQINIRLSQAERQVLAALALARSLPTLSQTLVQCAAAEATDLSSQGAAMSPPHPDHRLLEQAVAALQPVRHPRATACYLSPEQEVVVEALAHATGEKTYSAAMRRALYQQAARLAMQLQSADDEADRLLGRFLALRLSALPNQRRQHYARQPLRQAGKPLPPSPA